MPTWPSPRSERLGTPNDPAIRFARGTYFGASWFTHLLRPVRLLAPLYGSDWNAQPTGASTSRLSTDRSPSPLLDMTTTATGLLCWRDFHPLEWQLASLHQIRTCSFPAYGSHLGYPRQIYAAVCEPASLTCLSSTEPGACVADPHSPWSPPFAPPTPRRIAPLCSSASQLLWRSATSRARTSSATVPRLPDADRPSHATLTASHEISQLPTRSFFARDVALDPGGTNSASHNGIAHVAFDHEDSLRSREFIISWLTPTPHAIAVYASCSASPPPHATLASRRLARRYLGRTRTG